MEPDEEDWLDFDRPAKNSWVQSALVDDMRCNRPIGYSITASPKFKTGDVVRLKNGTAPMRVIKAQGYAIYCEYLSSRKQLGFRSRDDFVMYEANTAKELNDKSIKKETKMTVKLYKTVDGNRYGEYKANDGDKTLLLMQDSNTYEAFSADQIKRVMAFTFDVMFNGQSKVYSYLGTEGDVEAGDLLLTDEMSIARVVAIGTESESATKRFKGVKLAAVRLG
jgi:uncharacterized protein YodC (DUF2158 family)